MLPQGILHPTKLSVISTFCQEARETRVGGDGGKPFGRKLATISRAQRMALLNGHIRPVREEPESSMVIREDPPKK